MTMTVSTNNLVSINNRIVGRIHKQDAQPMRKPRPVRFYTGEPGTFDRLHKIDAQLYIGGPADWTINPAFEAAVAEIIGK